MQMMTLKTHKTRILENPAEVVEDPEWQEEDARDECEGE